MGVLESYFLGVPKSITAGVSHLGENAFLTV
jgi:hypothetical protein